MSWTKEQYMEGLRAAGQIAGIFGAPGGGVIGELAAQMTSAIIGEARRELPQSEADEVEARAVAFFDSDANKTNEQLAAERDAEQRVAERRVKIDAGDEPLDTSGEGGTA